MSSVSGSLDHHEIASRGVKIIPVIPVLHFWCRSSSQNTNKRYDNCVYQSSITGDANLHKTTSKRYDDNAYLSSIVGGVIG